MNRQQQRLDLILIPIENFCREPYNSNSSSPDQDDKHLWNSIGCKTSKPIQVIMNLNYKWLGSEFSDNSVQLKLELKIRNYH